ncbi:MAG: TlpA family protein disulfide reductase [Chloroflexota bacterium]|nr:TlpA family protein disulfide reductase [Chloroflexota bacterium]
MALLAPGTPAPTFKGMNLTGPEVNYENYKGKKAVTLIFSSTRIDPGQIKAVTDMWKKHREKTEIITVSYKLPSVSMAKSFMMQMGAKFPAIFDPTQAIYKSFGVENPVAIVIIDADGNIVYSAEALETKDTKALEEAIVANVK